MRLQTSLILTPNRFLKIGLVEFGIKPVNDIITLNKFLSLAQNADNARIDLNYLSI